MLSNSPTCETCRYWKRAADGMGSGICSRDSPQGFKSADGKTYTDRLSNCAQWWEKPRGLLGERRA